ncbi:MAG TPA: hypothetical protein VM711_02895 [Sphingomicrobium sp.]|nr:hypothetical protein [Sphingomicrobium sp.]
MSFLPIDSIRGFSTWILVLVLSAAGGLSAETAHVVSPSELQKQAVALSQTREQKVEKLRRFLSTPLAEQTIQKAHFHPVRVREAVPNLSDDELSALSARVDKAQQDFAAGVLSTRDIALIILLLVVIILIIVIAH